MKRIISTVILIFGLLFLRVTITHAEINAEETNINDNQQRYYFGSPVNTGKDNGYSETKIIEKNDPHFGWTLGKFFVSGYTRVTEKENGEPVFLKTVGDKVALWFNLEQDIDALNSNEMLTISEDTNGYDEFFGIPRTKFGRGVLIIRQTDYQNKEGAPIIYTDYLTANAKTGADTEVDLFEEGDYEVALNYEIKKSPVEIKEYSLLPTYTNYRVFFRFSIRNGNCMVYPFDVTTKAELTNSSITANGFYLDLAKSRYLDINIKKEVMKEGSDGLSEDIRFNKPAKDGDQYIEDGIYTISVSNRYSGQQTTKVIYVGINDVLKAHVVTGLSIKEVEAQLDMGARISSNGKILPPDPTPTSTSTSTSTSTPTRIVTTTPVATATSQLSEATAIIHKNENSIDKNADSVLTNPSNLRTEKSRDSQLNNSTRLPFIIITIILVLGASIYYLIKKRGMVKVVPPSGDKEDEDK